VTKKLQAYFIDREAFQIAQLYDKFEMTYNLAPVLLSRETLRARAAFIREELEELEAAVESGDYLETIDALVDIVVVVKGTAVMMGLRWARHWDEVQEANMRKKRGTLSKRPGLKEDLIKPPGWFGPDHLNVLDRY